LGRDVGIDLAARLVGGVHAEGLGAACRRVADAAAHAYDAQGLALQAAAEEEEHAPLPRLAGADDAFALAESASRHEGRPNAMSAVASVSTPGVFVATTPRSRHAATSMLS